MKSAFMLTPDGDEDFSEELLSIVNECIDMGVGEYPLSFVSYNQMSFSVIPMIVGITAMQPYISVASYKFVSNIDINMNFTEFRIEESDFDIERYSNNNEFMLSRSSDNGFVYDFYSVMNNKFTISSFVDSLKYVNVNTYYNKEFAIECIIDYLFYKEGIWHDSFISFLNSKDESNFDSDHMNSNPYFIKYQMTKEVNEDDEVDDDDIDIETSRLSLLSKKIF